MKKTLLLVLVLAACGALAIAGTLAYLNDTESAVNTFVTGDISIKLEEKTLGENNELVTFPTKEEGVLELLPGIQFAEGATPELQTEAIAVDDYNVTFWNSETAVKKIVSVRNTGMNPAFVRVWFALETVAGKEIGEVGVPHWNEVEGKYKLEQVGQEEIDGSLYDLYVYYYLDPVGVDSITMPSLLEVGMTWETNEEDMYTMGKNEYNVLVFAQAVQMEYTGVISGSGVVDFLDDNFGAPTVENSPFTKD